MNSKLIAGVLAAGTFLIHQIYYYNKKQQFKQNISSELKSDTLCCAYQDYEVSYIKFNHMFSKYTVVIPPKYITYKNTDIYIKRMQLDFRNEKYFDAVSVNNSKQTMLYVYGTKTKYDFQAKYASNCSDMLANIVYWYVLF